ncbi:MAG TPA: ergothioneine biosynthesis protein EgtB [Thermoanaerobaculia bacterium]|nr:ergothioneine biosynthesis protein EgtB [Thermoanaerobaculia bacterium]
MIDTLAAAPAAAGPALADRYRRVRAATEALCRPLVPEDYQVQSILETSPPKWHLAHVTWFFETFVLAPYAAGYETPDPRFAYVYNSYYQAVGPMHPRHERAVVARPTVDEVYAYRRHVDAAMARLLAEPPAADAAEIAFRTTLGLHHEQQHQELLLMDVKHNFAANPLQPAYREGGLDAVGGGPAGPAPEVEWLAFDGSLVEIGWDGDVSTPDGFAYDNETPRHRAWLEPYRLASRLVTNGEYRRFVEAGGYQDPQHWLSDGWAALRERGFAAPLYWRETPDGWTETTLAGPAPLDDALPVCHVSFYEADAYARWSGARLPTEAELEAATADQPLAGFDGGGFQGSGRYHPRRARSSTDRQWFGELWQWTRSPYVPYPGSKPLAGALGEYNAKFMANQIVLRGGCCATPADHLRNTYRNFFYPHDRWPFTGIRLARDGG